MVPLKPPCTFSTIRNEIWWILKKSTGSLWTEIQERLYNHPIKSQKRKLTGLMRVRCCCGFYLVTCTLKMIVFFNMKALLRHTHTTMTIVSIFFFFCIFDEKRVVLSIKKKHCSNEFTATVVPQSLQKLVKFRLIMHQMGPIKTGHNK